MHPEALLQIATFSSFFHDEAGPGAALEALVLKAQGQEGARGSDGSEGTWSARTSGFFREASVIGHLERQLQRWSEHGFDSALLAAAAQSPRGLGLSRVEKLKVDSLPLPDLTHWPRRLALLIQEGLEAFLASESHLGVLGGDDTYAFVEDSLAKLKAHLASPGTEDLLLFAALPQRQREGRIERVGASVKRGVLGFLHRAPARTGASWVGLKVDSQKVVRLLRQLLEAAGRMRRRSVGDQLLMEAAFVEEVRSQVHRQQTRSVCGSSSSTCMGSAMARRVPAFSSSNAGMPGAVRGYAEMSDEMKNHFFAASACAFHCEAIWRAAARAALPALQAPDLFKEYERQFGSPAVLAQQTNPQMLNSIRVLLRSDVTLGFLDRQTPSEVKTALKALSEGQGVIFTYSVLLGARLLSQTGSGFLALILEQQAPFMGVTAKEWIAQRKRAAVAALVSASSLLFLAAAVAANFAEVFKMLQSAGATPGFLDCVFNPVLQEISCSPAVGAAAGAPLAAALRQVLVLGLMSSSGAQAVAAGSAVSLLLASSKTLLRLQGVLFKAVTRFGTWLVRRANTSGWATSAGGPRRSEKIKVLADRLIRAGFTAKD